MNDYSFKNKFKFLHLKCGRFLKTYSLYSSIHTRYNLSSDEIFLLILILVDEQKRFK